MVNVVTASDLGNCERFAEGDFVLLSLVEFGFEAKFESILLDLKVLDSGIKPQIVWDLKTFDEEFLCLIREGWGAGNILSIFPLLEGDIGTHEAFIDAVIELIFGLELARPFDFCSRLSFNVVGL